MIEFNSVNNRMWSRLGSCGAFGIASLELPKNDKNTVILTPDLCFYSGLSRFKEEYPDNFYNLGIAEQNIIGVASGMAKEGLNPFVTTYASFVSRCLDQIKVNMGYMKFSIKLVGLTSGLAVGILGATHIAIEDIALIRSIPNITILSPCDCMETIKCILSSQKLNSPCYIRLTGSFNNPMVHKEDYDFEIGKSEVLKTGDDIAIFATGTMTSNALKTADELQKQGISCAVINVSTIKPFDYDTLNKYLNNKLIVTVEEHSIYGGLGSCVAEYLASKNSCKHLIIGIEDKYFHAGEYNYLIEKYGLSSNQITQRILDFYKTL